jgi:hypothetical protein
MLIRIAAAAALVAAILPASAAAQGTFEYVGKIVCGPQADSSSMAVVRGFYGSVINVRNPGRTAARIRKMVNWTLPPGSERPVEPRVVDTLTLSPSLAFAADCREVLGRTQTSPSTFHEGLFIVSSTVPLDVIGVYTAAAVTGGPSPFGGQVSSIHIAPFALRQR